MKRYGLFYLRGHDGEMEEDSSGEWVKYEDVAELQRQLAEACALIADLDAIRYELPEQARFAIQDYLGDTPK